MRSPTEDENRRLLRARDLLDRAYAEPLDLDRAAGAAHMSRAHFSRRFRALFGEPPHRYLQRRRIERACARLRNTSESVTDIARSVGFASLGTFGRTFADIVGCAPTAYRRRVSAEAVAVPSCIVKDWMRPCEAGASASAVRSSTYGEAASQRDS